jgi:hypothetical protein
MKMTRLRLSLILPALLLTTTHRAAAQGPITPPSAPSVPIMKTLDQVEPRIPVPGGGARSIDASGSYYLTGNINAVGANGITINAANVTLDLSGYTVACDSTTNGLACILIASTPNFTIRNGTLAGGSYGVLIHSNASTKCIQIDSLRISGCSRDGINSTGPMVGLSISNCLIAGIGDGTSTSEAISGITAYQGAFVKNCVIDTVTANGSTGSGISSTNPVIVQDCTVSNVTNTITPALATGLRLPTGSLAAGNRILKCYYGIAGGAKYQNNTTATCTDAFSGGTDAGGNN